MSHSKIPLSPMLAMVRNISQAGSLRMEKIMINRREMCSVLPFLALATSWAANDQTLSSTIFPFDELQKKEADGHITRPVVNGKISTGEHVEVHETTLSPGVMPHAPHRHAHSEFWLIREGTVELTINGQTHRLGPGGVGLATGNDLHGIKNVGDTPAQYFVVAIGEMKA
jgi:quercetin dioxygenase-like cupin family protein